MLRLSVILATVLGVVALTTAAAASTMAVPLGVQQAIKKHNPQMGFVPTRLPAGYHYIKWTQGRRGFDIYFGPAATPVMGFDALQTSCATYGHPMKTFHLNGVTVYWSATHEDQQAWRCISHDLLHIGLEASRSIPGDETTNTPSKLRHALELARLVAYARRVS